MIDIPNKPKEANQIKKNKNRRLKPQIVINALLSCKIYYYHRHNFNYLHQIIFNISSMLDECFNNYFSS